MIFPRWLSVQVHKPMKYTSFCSQKLVLYYRNHSNDKAFRLLIGSKHVYQVKIKYDFECSLTCSIFDSLNISLSELVKRCRSAMVTP